MKTVNETVIVHVHHKHNNSDENINSTCTPQWKKTEEYIEYEQKDNTQMTLNKKFVQPRPSEKMSA